jgi:hypothetical protein
MPGLHYTRRKHRLRLEVTAAGRPQLQSQSNQVIATALSLPLLLASTPSLPYLPFQ